MVEHGSLNLHYAKVEPTLLLRRNGL